MMLRPPLSRLPVPGTPRARKWIAAGILLVLLLEGASWWREYENGTADRQIARRIEAFHVRSGGLQNSLVESLHRINARNYRADRKELNAALAGVLEAPLPGDVKTQGILLIWLRHQGADPASFPILNRPLGRDLLEWCLQHGADPNMQDGQGNTALHYHWNEEELGLLLDAGADITVRNNAGRTPWQDAISRGEPEAAINLLREGDRTR